MGSEKLGWYLNRLASMSAEEVLHRTKELVKKKLSSLRQYKFDAIDSGNRSLPVIPGLREGLESVRDEDDLLDAWGKLYSEARSGRYQFLGQQWPEHVSGSFWSLDPVSGEAWPKSEYCFDIPYRHAADYGDIKFTWEINRLQYLQPIAALAAISKDSTMSAFCVDQLESWIDENPPFNGVNWSSGIELACRIVSILVLTSLLSSDQFSPRQLKKIWSTLAAHGYWLYRYPSRYSSANNHLVAEACALFILGVVAPGLKESRKWLRYGQQTIEAEVLKQIYPDGVGAEQSPTYLAFTVEWFVLVGQVASSMEVEMKPCFREQLASAGEYFVWLTDCNGNQPRIGDDDEGRVLYHDGSPHSYVNSIMSCVSAFLGRKDLAPPTRCVSFREILFGKVEPCNKARNGLKIFEKGGYTIYRGVQGEQEHMLLFDHGPLGYLSIAAHGHADALSIWLHIDGQPVLVDSGTYLYHSGGEWRDYMRSTAAHNTLAINGESTSRISGPFNWSKKANSKLLHSVAEGKGFAVTAEHDGYFQAYGTVHKRKIESRSFGEYVVTDMLVGGDERFDVEIGFLLNPLLSVRMADDGFDVYGEDGRRILNISNDSKELSASLQYGSDNPPGGWYSDQFNSKVPTYRLVFSGGIKSDMEVVTRILSVS